MTSSRPSSRSVESILKGLLSFMLEPTQTAGSIVTSDVEKKRLARHSLKFNLADPTFCELFPEVSVLSFMSVACERLISFERREQAVELIKKDLADKENGVANGAGSAAASGGPDEGPPKPTESPLDSVVRNFAHAVPDQT